MRYVILDTETTGLNPQQGDRVIEIACVELIQRRQTDRVFHVYLNPERAIDPGAVAVHGLTETFLADKPKFADIAHSFVEFIRGATLVAHNASFDLGFLNHELARLPHPPIDQICPEVIDTLKLARAQYPGQRNSLDALCQRLNVDNTHRTRHGALLDAELLLNVYLAMTRGQHHLFDEPQTHTASLSAISAQQTVKQSTHTPLQLCSAEDNARHQEYLNALSKEKACLWPSA